MTEKEEMELLLIHPPDTKKTFMAEKEEMELSLYNKCREHNQELIAEVEGFNTLVNQKDKDIQHLENVKTKLLGACEYLLNTLNDPFNGKRFNEARKIGQEALEYANTT